ncbi:ABC transporter permease [Pontibacillus chungwhensis BH030062]|uniref:ABC transporter permease n=1 Tax=Pontibacillus chungwhensis BH030062 TaxID=1385513 RepID=A0A0A2UTL6_9BACI|nr:ABC transporter permease [Pontibacillus chungwhensis]KGP90113.1 ABC transporter permease [Pontibacillus chungwhensis BH030062]
MKLSETNKAWILLTPALLFLSLPAYGLFSAIWTSLHENGSFTTKHYRTLFQQETFWESIGYSVRITLLSTVLSLVLGLLITRAFSPFIQSTKGKLSIWLPMLFPHFVWGYIVLLLFEQSGLISHLLVEMGLISSTSSFPIITNDQNGIGIILTYVGKETPFVVLMLLPIYAKQQDGYKDLVQTLGGGKWAAFKDAEWPWVSPVLLEAGIILFAFILSAYEVPFLLGATFPEMISVLTYDWFYSGDWNERPLAFAAMIITSVLIGIMSFIAFSAMNRKRMLLTKGQG